MIVDGTMPIESNGFHGFYQALPSQPGKGLLSQLTRSLEKRC